MQYKCRRLAPVFSAVVAALAGCSAAPTTAVERPFRDAALTVAGPAGVDSTLRAPVRTWQALQAAAPATFVPLDPSQGPAKPADVWVFPAWQLAHWVAAGKVQPLAERLTRRDGASAWPGVLPIYRDQLLLWRGPTGRVGTAYAVPLLGEAPLLCYRADLYADAEHRRKYREANPDQELRPPQSWAEFVRQAAYFHRAGFPLPALPDDPAALERLFGQVAAGYARRPALDQGPGQGPLPESALALFQDLATGAPRLEEPAFVHALGVLRAMQASRGPRGDGAPEEAFRAGRAALCLCEAPWLVRFQEARSPVRDKVGVAGLPGAEKVFDGGEGDLRQPNRMPYLGGGALVAALPADAPNKDAAESLLGHLLDRRVSTQLILDPRDAVRVVRGEQLEDGVKWDVLGLDGERTQAAKAALRWTLEHPTLKNAALALRGPDAAAYRDALVRHLRRALVEGVAAKDALAAAAAEWRALAEKAGPEKTRAAARLSVGLAP